MNFNDYLMNDLKVENSSLYNAMLAKIANHHMHPSHGSRWTVASRFAFPSFGDNVGFINYMQTLTGILL